MSDIEVDVLNDEKDDNGSDYLAFRRKNEVKSRKCMDLELHNSFDDIINDDNGNLKVRHDRQSKEELVKKTESSRICDFDSDEDEDTFADADSDCEPNQFFLDEMLEEYHPERLNLMDYRKEEKEINKGESSSDTQIDENDIVYDSDDDEHKFEDSSTSRHDENDEDDSGHDKVIRTLNVDVECESATDQSGDDSFGNLPTIRDKGKRPQMGRNNLGASPGEGPGRPLLRQASQKAVWGK